MKPSWKALASHCVAAAAIAMVVKPTPARGGDMAMPPAAATEWLNSPPQTATDLRGKVVVVQFWTFTCINWRRTLPYMRAWDAKYRDQGLIVIGVHTPEFDFEENVQNVRSELAEMHIDYPVAIDNQHAIWNAFHNVYWPALYLLDPHGHIRYRQFGEGEYARTEREIRKLLAESGGRLSSDLFVRYAVRGRQGSLLPHAPRRPPRLARFCRRPSAAPTRWRPERRRRRVGERSPRGRPSAAP
jgi:thiol-disulfide isomerase/thioredoxin